jgi:long-chain acyl-CoA synthetase
VQRATLLDFFHDLARAPGKFLVHDDGFRSRAYSYAEVGRNARAFAARLHEAGISKGDHVIFWSENRPEWIIAFWGCLLGGVVVVPIDYRSSPEFVARVSGIVKAKLAFVGHDVPSLVLPLEAPVWRLHEMEWGDGEPPRVDIRREDLAEIIFTSGATAEPKGVLITHANVLANVVPVEREILKYRKYARPFQPLRFLNLLPLSHMFGQAMATFIPPMLAGEVIFIRGYNPAEIVAQIRQRRVSVLICVPKILEVLREHVGRIDPAARAVMTGGPTRPLHFAIRWWVYRRAHRLFGLKFWAFVVGAAPLDDALEKFWGELGFAVVQGYGLTETAPIVTLNHPFAMRKGSVGKPIAGVQIRIASDGEILVRGENVTQGYFNAADETAQAFEDGWFHTGDIGEVAPDGQLYIRGRKKEMIVTPEGLNVFPEDVERVLNGLPGVRESAVVGAPVSGSEERVHAALVLEAGADIDTIVRDANARLADHQKIRRALAWPDAALPRTEGTGKIKRAIVREWVRTGAAPQPVAAGGDRLGALLAKYAGRTDVAPATTLDELGLSSLDRVELMVALEEAFQMRIDEHAFADANNVQRLRSLIEQSAAGQAPVAESFAFPAWNRSRGARAVRRISLATWLLPLARVFAWIHVDGRERLQPLDGPAIFAANHQSHMDAPVVLAALPARLRYRTAIAMAKEFFAAHFHPETHRVGERLTNSLNYYLAALFFNAFPLPQRELGARDTLRYISELVGNGSSILIFPEGKRSVSGEIDRFRPGIGMIASRVDVPVVPVRIEGLDRVLPPGAQMARPGRVRVAFGAPLRLAGDDYEAIAKQVEDAVRAL